MKYCSSCGQQIDDNAKFCAHCGTTQSPQTPAPQPFVPGGKRLHCPKCKGDQLSPVVETDVQGGYAVNRSVGRKWGASAIDLKSTHRNYWMCQSCGHKFRNLDSLDEEIATMEKGKKASLALIILFAVLMLITVIAGGGVGMPSILPIIMGFFLWLLFKNKITKMQQERAVLERECFN